MEETKLKVYNELSVYYDVRLTVTFYSCSGHHHDQNNDNDDNDDEDLGKRSELLCDGCITPIYSPSSPSPSSSSSSLSDDYYNYMSCSECKYNLHLACFNLPPRIPSLPFLHQLRGHELVLINPCDENRHRDFLDIYCHVCELCTDGLMYACRICRFKADIKCASLPHTIHHEARPQRLLNLVTPDDILSNNIRVPTTCGAGCNRYLWVSFCYTDSSYEFVVDARCMVLPASVRCRRWDRHHPWMPLTYDTNLNHPGELYCDKCETEMNPKSWMYHCRDCDLSFHPECFQTTSGYYRNFKFGLLYSISEAHPHILTYQLLTDKEALA